MDQQQDTFTLRDQTQRLNVDRQGDPSVDPFRNLQEEPSYDNMEQQDFRLQDQPRTLDSFYNKVNLLESTLVQSPIVANAQEREQDSPESIFQNEWQQNKQKKQKNQPLTKNILQFVADNVQKIRMQKELSKETIEGIAELKRNKNFITLNQLLYHRQNSSEFRILLESFLRKIHGKKRQTFYISERSEKFKNENSEGRVDNASKVTYSSSKFQLVIL